MNGLTLSAADCDRFRNTLSVLLSPLACSDVNVWREQVNDAMRVLLDADMVTFHLPLPGIEALQSREVEVAKLRAYPSYLHQWQTRLGMAERMRQLGIWSRETLWGRDAKTLYRSEYWNEFVPAVRSYDALGATVSLPSSGAATLYFHHQSPRGRRFGSRGARLLRMALPAFRAAVLSRARIDASARTLSSFLDLTNQPIQLTDRAGRTVHRNPAMAWLLENATEPERLEVALRRVASSVAMHSRDGRRLMEAGSLGGTALTVTTSSSRYRLWGSIVPDLLSTGDGILVVAELQNDGATLATRFHLTPRERQVARLLAERKSNTEIAAALHISPHTARHHTERTLAKLGVRTRRLVAKVIADGVGS